MEKRKKYKITVAMLPIYIYNVFVFIFHKLIYK